MHYKCFKNTVPIPTVGTRVQQKCEINITETTAGKLLGKNTQEKT